MWQYSKNMKHSLKRRSQSLNSSDSFKQLISFPNLKIRTSFKHEIALKLAPPVQPSLLLSTKYQKISNGKVDNKSIQNLPFKQFFAINIGSNISAPVIGLTYDVLNYNRISQKKQMSMIVLKNLTEVYQNDGGENASPRGILKLL